MGSVQTDPDRIGVTARSFRAPRGATDPKGTDGRKGATQNPERVKAQARTSSGFCAWGGSSNGLHGSGAAPSYDAAT
jgi:hypothetical protein